MIWLWSALGTLGALAVGLGLAVFLLYTRLKTLLQNQHQQLQQQIASGNLQVVSLSQRLAAIEKGLDLPAGRQLQSVNDHTFATAEVLAAQGVDAKQLSENLGIPEAEANLLSLVKSGGNPS